MRIRYSLTAMFALVLACAVAVRTSQWAYHEWYVAQQPIPWQTFTPTAVDDARGKGQIVLLHVTADWDLVSVYMRTAMETNSILRAIHHHDVLPILADVTSLPRAQVWKYLRQFGVNYATPLTIVYPAESTNRPVLIVGEFDEEALIASIEYAAGTSAP